MIDYQDIDQVKCMECKQEIYIFSGNMPICDGCFEKRNTLTQDCST